jgi:hypothetical protein
VSAGRLLREQMRDAAAETPERVAERIAYRGACEQAYAETMSRFAPLTAENLRAALDWQAARINELMAAAC